MNVCDINTNKHLVTCLVVYYLGMYVYEVKIV